MVDHTIFRNSETFKGLDTKSSDVSRGMQYSSDMRNAMYKLSGAICKRKGFSLKESFTEEVKGMYTLKNISSKTGAVNDELLVVTGNKIKSYKKLDAKIISYLNSSVANNNRYDLPASDIDIKLKYDSTTNYFYVYEDSNLIYELPVTEEMTVEELRDRLSWGVHSMYNAYIADDIEFYSRLQHDTLFSTWLGHCHIEMSDVNLVQHNDILKEALGIIRAKGPNYLTKISTDLQNIPSNYIFNPLLRFKRGGSGYITDNFFGSESTFPRSWYSIDQGTLWYIPDEDILVKRTSTEISMDTATQIAVRLYDNTVAYYDKPTTSVLSDRDKAYRDNLYTSRGLIFPCAYYAVNPDNGSPSITDFFEHLAGWVAPYDLNNVSSRNSNSDTLYPTSSNTRLNFRVLGGTGPISDANKTQFDQDDASSNSYFIKRLAQEYPTWVNPNSDSPYLGGIFQSDLDWDTQRYNHSFIKRPNHIWTADPLAVFNSSLYQNTGVNGILNSNNTNYLGSSGSYQLYDAVAQVSLKAAPLIERNPVDTQQTGSSVSVYNKDIQGRSFFFDDASSWSFGDAGERGYWFMDPSNPPTKSLYSEAYSNWGEFLSKSPIVIDIIEGSSGTKVRSLDSFEVTLNSSHYDLVNKIDVQSLSDVEGYLIGVDKNTSSLNCVYWNNAYEENVFNEAETENCSFASLNEVVYISNGLDNVKKYDGQYVYRAGVPNAVDPNAVGDEQYDSSNQYMYLFEYTDYKGNIISGEPRYIDAANIATFDFPAADDPIFEGFDTLSSFDLEWQSVNNQDLSYTPAEAQYKIEKLADEKRMRIKIYDNGGSTNRLHYLAYDLGVMDTSFRLSDLGFTSFASEDDTNLAYQPDDKRHDPPPKGRYLATFKNCLVISGQYENANNVQYSLPFSTSTLEIGSEYFPSEDNAVIVESKEGNRITAMYPFRDVIYIFHDSSISLLSGDIGVLETPSVRSISQEAGVGCVANTSIQELNGQVVFLSSKGFYSLYNTVQVRKFSEIIDNLFIDTSSLNRQLNRSISFIWEEKELFISIIPELTFEQSSGKYILNKDNSLLLAYDYSKDAWLRWDNIEFTGGAANFDNEVYFSKIDTSSNYKLCKMSNDNVAEDYSDEGSAINFYYETNWESLNQPSIPKKFLRLKMHFMDVDKDFENDGFSLKIAICKDYIQGEAASINIDLEDVFNKGWGEFSWGSDTWGGNWGGGVNNIFVKHKLPNFKAKSLKLIFSNSDNNQNIFINNWEYELANTYSQEIKD